MKPSVELGGRKNACGEDGIQKIAVAYRTSIRFKKWVA
jgi:hypothetical protein